MVTADHTAGVSSIATTATIAVSIVCFCVRRSRRIKKTATAAITLCTAAAANE